MVVVSAECLAGDQLPGDPLAGNKLALAVLAQALTVLPATTSADKAVFLLDW
jgi:hypothetical protein